MLDVSEQQVCDACSCARFVSLVTAKGPFDSIATLLDACRFVWWHEVSTRQGSTKLIFLGPSIPYAHAIQLVHTILYQARVTDWLEAFAAHPRIGDIDSLKAKYSNFAKMSQSEQATASSASGDVLQVPHHPTCLFCESCQASMCGPTTPHEQELKGNNICTGIEGIQ